MVDKLDNKMTATPLLIKGIGRVLLDNLYNYYHRNNKFNDFVNERVNEEIAKNDPIQSFLYDLSAIDKDDFLKLEHHKLSSPKTICDDPRKAELMVRCNNKLRVDFDRLYYYFLQNNPNDFKVSLKNFTTITLAHLTSGKFKFPYEFKIGRFQIPKVFQGSRRVVTAIEFLLKDTYTEQSIL